jgi:2-oxoglutarate dehydrogenase E1 component
MNYLGIMDADYIEKQYRLWKSDPGKVSRDWHYFFQGFELGHAKAPEATPADSEKQGVKQSGAESLIYRYRDLGHLLACLDPLVACPTDHPFLALSVFDLSENDLDNVFHAPWLSKSGNASLLEIIQALKETYCRSIGVEYMHIQDPSERQWLQDRMEPVRNKPELNVETKSRILQKLYQAALFEQFLNKKYLGQTRFSLEGADAVIPLLDCLLQQATQQGCGEIILGMSHRGRLNVQAHVLERPYEDIFSEFESCYDPENLVGSGDVKYHNGYLADIKTPTGSDLRLYLVNNPSHLESVNPTVEGFTRARQDLSAQGERNRVMPVLIHGDAAFSGQGIVTETLNMSQLKGYSTGGTIHIIINNQIGYTTLPDDARSTRYATDPAKMLMVPIFHVHGEDPEAVIHATRTACDYRMAFGKDVVIDVVCYRRYGHNEGDEPYFTQPQMYQRIRERDPLFKMYGNTLIESDIIEKVETDRIETRINRRLNDAYLAIHGTECPFPQTRFYENWDGFIDRYSHDSLETGVNKKTLMSIARGLNTLPDGFALHPKLEKILKSRLDAVINGKGIDWANAEALAFGSLLLAGFPIRLSGQDSGRGTFSQRHSVLTDTNTGNWHIPLNALGKKQAAYTVYDSLLSEAGVLGFEYGYSLAQPNGLVLWEAQFGDFANNAQAVIDLYIASGETKWQRLSGLVMLLPHGFEGLGPEHSSARVERFLQLCAHDNMQICNATTPAQYFHLLRRQIKQKYRKPLVILTPKSLLRHPLAVSGLDDLTTGFFKEVLGDPDGAKSPNRILLCSGKIYYDLLRQRQNTKASHIEIIRLEQLYPFPAEQLAQSIKGYKKSVEWCWVQEEPENMGGWRFLQPLLESVIEKTVSYIGREPASSPATGFPAIYKEEQAAIVEKAMHYQ